MRLEIVIREEGARIMTNLQSAGVQNEMRVQLAFIAGRPHVEFCGTSRADASEADVSALFDKAKAAAIAALRSAGRDAI
ncbi:hypothetical protein [uncultured Cloacibacillus sp.]|uniref:hypothetical protein n=1 Tax=uncultured Cloacibacillus sp. TaxID=889794 RepID=UPI00320AB7DE